MSQLTYRGLNDLVERNIQQPAESGIGLDRLTVQVVDHHTIGDTFQDGLAAPGFDLFTGQRFDQGLSAFSHDSVQVGVDDPQIAQRVFQAARGKPGDQSQDKEANNPRDVWCDRN